MWTCSNSSSGGASGYPSTSSGSAPGQPAGLLDGIVEEMDVGFDVDMVAGGCNPMSAINNGE